MTASLCLCRPRIFVYFHSNDSESITHTVPLLCTSVLCTGSMPSVLCAMHLCAMYSVLSAICYVQCSMCYLQCSMCYAPMCYVQCSMCYAIVFYAQEKPVLCTSVGSRKLSVRWFCELNLLYDLCYLYEIRGRSSHVAVVKAVSLCFFCL